MSAHDVQAHAAAEEAIERLFLAEDQGECACVTCITREALEAAWPHLRLLALEEAASELTEVVREFGRDADMRRFAQALGLLARGWLGRD